jgi:hypothetical protein
MTFSFKYKSIRLNSGDIIYRPLIPLTLIGKEKLDILAILDSGSDITIIPKEIAEILSIEYTGENEISGISKDKIKAKEGKLLVKFGKGREIYDFEIPILVPIDKENLSIIIGRAGFFNEFKISFSESERKIEFKKSSPHQSGFLKI